MLKGVRVLDLSRQLPGPYATMLMAGLGAEVIKLEEPGQGDLGRVLPLFELVNRGKRSVAVNLKEAAGRDLALRLAATCDVWFESFRPGVMSSLGLDYEAVRRVNPRMVYASMTGWGQTGPLAGHAGHDINYLSIAGVLGVTGVPGVGPVVPGVQIGDLGGGMLAVVGILSAVLQARATGKGTYLDVAMYDLLVSWLVAPVSEYAAGGGSPGWREGMLSGSVNCYNLYETADGQWMALGALEPKFWTRFCEATGRSDLAGAAFAPARTGGAGYEAVRALFRQRSRAEWTELGRRADCCLTPVLSLPEALESDQLRARGMAGSPHPLHGSVGGAVTSPAPALGADTAEILAALGLTASEIAQLAHDGAIGLR